MSARRSSVGAGALALALAALVQGCRDEASPLNVVPLEPSGAIADAGDSIQAVRVNTFVSEAPSVLVTDRLGNPVPGVVVTFQVTAGGGSVDPEADTTDALGRATTTWKLGTAAGPNTLLGTAAGVGDVEFSAVGLPGPPTRVLAVSGDRQSATVATPLAQPLVAESQDAFGNPTPGVEMRWTAQDTSASVTPESATTDSLGRASVLWTLGKRSGTKRLQVRAGQGGLGFLSATALPDAPAAIVAADGDGQTGSAGAALPKRLTARVVDQYGNGVPSLAVAWSVTEGSGSVDPPTAATDSAGRALTRWVVGTTPDVTERVSATFASMPPVEFTAQTTAPDNLVIDGLYVTQAAQTYAGDVPLVAGRDGLLRVFALAGAANAHDAEVEVRLYQNGALFRTETLRRDSEPVPTSSLAAEPDLAQSWNLFIPGAEIQPGLSIEAEVDPGGLVHESDDGDNVFAPAAFDVRVIPDFQVTLVPIQVFTSQGETIGNANEANKTAWLGPALSMFPMAGYDVAVREVFTSGIGELRDFEPWSRILEEISALRVSDGSSRHYYGIVGQQSSALCGLAYVRGYSGVGMDGPCGAATAAHEWGHNFGRYHAPCGGPAGVDQSYPYAGASIGIYGVDVARLLLRSPEGHADLMSYCAPEWISDYTYEGVLEFRDAFGAPSAAVAPAPEPSLVIWGRIEGGRVVLEPSFEAVTVPSLPQAPGPFRLEGFDGGGARLFELPFAGTAVDHIDGLRHFAFALPAELARPDVLDRLRVTGPGAAVAEVRRGELPPEIAAEATATREAAGRVRLEWDGARHGLAVIRSARTGRILAFGRGERALLDARTDELDVTLASGVGEVRRRVVVR